MKRRPKFIFVFLVVLLSVSLFISLLFFKRKSNGGEARVKEERLYYFQQFLLNYTLPHPSSCESKSGGNLKEENIPRTPSVKYNGTLVQNMYVPGFDILPKACPNEGCGVDLLVVVHTSHKNVDLRTAVRLTWKLVASLPNVVVVFLLGKSEDNKLPRQAMRESQLFGDVIVSRNIDTYDNLTLKSVAMAEWVASNCRKARFVLKADDDVFLNVVRLLQFVSRPEVAASSRTFYGAVTNNSKPVREVSHKFYISVDEFAGEVYPDYLQGSSYVFTGDLSRDLYHEALKQNFFRMEDIFITGFLADHLNARRVNVRSFRSEFTDVVVKTKRFNKVNHCDLRSRISIHYVSYENIFKLWKVLFGESHWCKEHLD